MSARKCRALVPCTSEACTEDVRGKPMCARHARFAPGARKRAVITLVRGPEGFSIYLNYLRVVGRKPWGGGKALAEWEITEADVLEALRETLPPKPKAKPAKRAKAGAS